MDVLGIGANMVKALRYWMTATQIAQESNSGKRRQSLTDIGEVVYRNDPYFEEIGSLALVHYGLASNSAEVTAWYIFFNEFDYIEFSEDDFQSNVKKYVRMAGENLPSERSVSDDFKCIINTYYSKQNSNDNPEDNIESPLTELGLIEYLYNKNNVRVYKKVMIKENLLPDLIALAIILDNTNGEKELKISTLLKGENSIGKVFNLDMVRIINILYRLEKQGYIKVVRTAGLDIVELLTDMKYADCVQLYYDKLNQ